MRLLLRSGTGEFSLTRDLVADDGIPPYAILSHTWGPDDEEVTFEDMTNSTGKNKPGYEKIRFCGEQARQDGLEYFWIDTCCINRKNYAELSHAINSMFLWYRNATRCYVYLTDVSTWQKKTDGGSRDTWESDFRRSRWFTRGWTLQELLAPASVEFFSRERQRLGNKSSLERQIHEITGVSKSALYGDPLSQFGVNERLSWIDRRQTKLEEDKAYSLLGIFGVYVAPLYGEGMASAFKRLHEEINKLEKCMQDLHLTDPDDDKRRIEDTQGGLLEASYHWILENPNYQQWRSAQQSRLLWIKGDPGKGKTMLLCGIVNELRRSKTKSDLLSYFFCQATDSRINNATAVLRGLISLLVNQLPYLASHVRKKYDHGGKALFEDANAWVALSEIFNNILQDPNLNSTYIIVDALDECKTHLPELLDFIVQKSSVCLHVKWLVSSRSSLSVEERLDQVGWKVRLCLELNAESVSAAVNIFIQHKVCQLAQEKKYDNKTQNAVLKHLFSNANDTFLWAALVCQNLKTTPRGRTLARLKSFPPGLDPLYKRMMTDICESEDSDLCKQILASITTVYVPITLTELTSLVEMHDDMSDNVESLREIISFCVSFLTVQKDTIYLVHQSAKDYLLAKASDEIFPSEREETHYEIFSRSLEVMSRTLRRDVYSLGTLGCPIERVKQPDPDPLRASRYSCIYWVDHLCDWNPISSANHEGDLRDGGVIDAFLREKYLYWLEALSLLRNMSAGVRSMAKLEEVMQTRADVSQLTNLVRDARRFVMYHKWAIENSPLQAYASALVFSPARGLTKDLFKSEEPKWIRTKPSMEENWNPCLQTLEGHSHSVRAVAFSPDSRRLVSASDDQTVKIWDSATGQCLQTVESHNNSVAFSLDSRYLASASNDQTVKIWDPATGQCLWTLKGHSRSVNLVVFSPDSRRLASASYDWIVKIWDPATGQCLQTLEGHSNSVRLMAFSLDLRHLVSALDDQVVKIWDLATGQCLQTLEGHNNWVNSVAFSPDSRRLASASNDQTVKIWDSATDQYLQTLEGYSRSNLVVFSLDSRRLASASGDRTVKIWDLATGQCLQTLEGHSHPARSVAFSLDSLRLASGSDDRTVKIWDPATGRCLWTLKGHNRSVNSVTFSLDSLRLASASDDQTVKIWDLATGQCLQTLEGYSNWVNSVAFSPDSRRLASALDDQTVKIWDPVTGQCLQTLEGHNNWVNSVAFSPDSRRLVSASGDRTVKIWDLATGQCLQTLEGHSSSIRSVAFSPDSHRLASASYDRTVKIWDLATGQCLQTLEGHSRSVNSVAFSLNLRCLASASDDQTVKIWDLAIGHYLEKLEGHNSWVNSVAFSPGSRRLASSSYDRTVKIWDLATGQCLPTLEGYSNSVNSVVFSPDSRCLASASGDQTVKVWDPATGQCLQTLESHSSSVRSVVFSLDSLRLASASDDQTVKIWDLATGQCLQTLEGHSDSVRSIAFSPTSRRLASVSDDKTVKIWGLATGQCLQTLEGHSHSAHSVAFSPDSRRLASASYDQTVKIWDPTTGQCLQTFEGPKAVYHISFDTTGSYLYTDIGAILLNKSSTTISASIQAYPPRQPHFQSYSISLDETWITWNGQNLLWLPPEYRPVSWAVAGPAVVLGCASGRVLLFQFSEVPLP